MNESQNMSHMEPVSPINAAERQETIMLGDEKSPVFGGNAFKNSGTSGDFSPLLGGQKRISTGINPDNLDDSFTPLDRMNTVNL